MSDPRTIEDFAATVQTTERLKHLLVLTEVDIKAVGPGVWNGWKPSSSVNYISRPRPCSPVRVPWSIAASAWRRRNPLSASPCRKTGRGASCRPICAASDAYWLNFPTDVQVHHAALIEKSKTQPLIVDARPDPERACAEITVICQDDAGLFARLSGACASAGMDILDARISTTNNGLAVDVLHVQEAGLSTAPDATRTQRLCKIMRAALEGSVNLNHPPQTEMSEKTRRTLKTKTMKPRSI